MNFTIRAAMSCLFLASIAHADPVTIGVLLPLTGSFANYGAKLRDNFTAEAAKHGFKTVVEDEGCDPNKAVTSYKKVSDLDGAKFFFGPWCGSPQRAVAEQIKTRDQLAILGSSAPADLYEVSHEKMLSTQYSIQSESTFLGEAMNKRGLKKVAIIYFDNGFSRAHEEAFRAAFKGEVLDAFRYSENSTSQLKSIALKIKALKPDAIYMPDAFPLLGGFSKELTFLHLTTPIFGVFSFQFPDVLTATAGYQGEIIYSYTEIGEADALEYFPRKASELLFEGLATCKDNPTCVKNYLEKKYSFGKDGAIASTFKLKQIKNGAFVSETN